MTAIEEVRRYVEALGGTVETSTFDCGDVVAISMPGTKTRRFRSECGDPQSAAELALIVVQNTIAEATRMLGAIEAGSGEN